MQPLLITVVQNKCSYNIGHDLAIFEVVIILN